MEQIQIKSVNVTELLLERLFKAPDLKTYMKDNADLMEMPPFGLLISGLCKKAGIPKARIIDRSDIPRNYAYQLFNGIRNPSRDKVIQLAFGFGMDVEDTQELLKIARQAQLYPKIPRDSVILRCLHEHQNMGYTQNILGAMGLTLLGREDKYE
ncbi:MAG: hypothetical protein ACOX25_06225 [Caldicoprobacterales bacterium]